MRFCFGYHLIKLIICQFEKQSPNTGLINAFNPTKTIAIVHIGLNPVKLAGDRTPTVTEYKTFLTF